MDFYEAASADGDLLIWRSIECFVLMNVSKLFLTLHASPHLFDTSLLQFHVQLSQINRRVDLNTGNSTWELSSNLTDVAHFCYTMSHLIFPYTMQTSLGIGIIVTNNNCSTSYFYWNTSYVTRKYWIVLCKALIYFRKPVPIIKSSKSFIYAATLLYKAC